MPITYIEPTRGGPAGGTTVLVIGSGFTGATAVTFGGVPGTEVTVYADSVLTVVSPAHAAGVVDVAVDVGGSLAAAFTYAIEVTGIVASIGGLSGGQAVRLGGLGLTGVTQVNFGGAPATDVVVVDDGTVTCATPPHAAGVVDVEVVGVGTLVGGFTYDTVDWTQVLLGYGGADDFRDSIYVAGTGFVFVGDNGLIFTSPDGSAGSWTQRTSSPSGAHWKGVTYSPSLGRFLAVGNSGAAATSDDGGATWTARTATAANLWASACWSEELGLFCAVALGGTNRVMTSPDGITWTAHAAAAAKTWLGVCWHAPASLFVAVAWETTSADDVMTSPDGSTWTLQATNAVGTVTWQGYGKSIRSSSVLGSVVYGSYGDDLGGGSSTSTPVRIEQSVDGVAWTHTSIPGSGRPERLVDAPALGLVLALVDWTYLTSADGVAWTQTAIPASPLTHVGDFCACWADDLGILVAAVNGTPDKMMVGTFLTEPVVPVVIAPITLADVSSGGAYTEQLTATGGDGGPYTFTVLSGTLPAGLSLSSAGLLSGTPTDTPAFSPTSWPPALVDVGYDQSLAMVSTTAVPYVFTVRATDSVAAAGDQAYAVDAIVWTPPETFLVLGTLPKCLTCTSAGRITGIPMTVGTWTITIRATDAVGRTLDRDYTLTVTS